MINYIFELVSFVAAVVMYVRSDYNCMAVWLIAAVMFGFSGVISEFIFKKFSHKEVKNG